MVTTPIKNLALISVDAGTAIRFEIISLTLKLNDDYSKEYFLTYSIYQDDIHREVFG
jgi:hypothetical protein